MNPRRLYRSRDRRLAGVAGGMAEYLDIDPTVMRILWVLAGLLSVGFAILAYILLAIVIPDAPWSAAPAGAPAMWGQAGQGAMPGWAQPGPAWAPSPPSPQWAPSPPSPQSPQWQAGAPAQAPTAYGPAQAPAAYGPAQTAGSTSGWATASAQPSGWGTAGAAYQSREQGRGIGVAGVVGLALIAIGGIALLNVVIPGSIVRAASGPLILILIGGAFLVSAVRRTPAGTAATLAEAGDVPAPAAAAADTNSDDTDSDDTAVVDSPPADASPEAGGSAPS